MARATFTLTPSAISTSMSGVSVDHLGHLADDAAGGDDGVAAPHVLDHLLMLLHPLLLRPDDQEPHDDENEDERNETVMSEVVAIATEGPLRVSGRNEQVALHG